MSSHRLKRRSPDAPFTSHDTEFGIFVEFALTIAPETATSDSTTDVNALLTSGARLTALAGLCQEAQSLRIYRPNEDVRPHPQRLSLAALATRVTALLTSRSEVSAGKEGDATGRLLRGAVAAIDGLFGISYNVVEPLFPSIIESSVKLAASIELSCSPPALFSSVREPHAVKGQDSAVQDRPVLEPLAKSMAEWVDMFSKLRRLPSLLKVICDTLNTMVLRASAMVVQDSSPPLHEVAVVLHGIDLLGSILCSRTFGSRLMAVSLSISVPF